MTNDPRTPTTLIAGFLGAGKTTLLNHLLHEGYGGRRFALIVNDFGKVAVDATLVEHAEDDMLVMRNGCVCCTLVGDLLRGLGRLLAREPYDAIIMETSGVTNVPVLKQYLEHPELADRLRLERIVTVVDAVRYLKQRAAILVVDQQVRLADVVLLNRRDAAPARQRREAAEAIRSVNPRAKLIETEYCRISVAELVGSAQAPGKAGAAAKPLDDHPKPLDDQWYTARVLLPTPISRERLEKLLSSVREPVLRLKGFVRAPDGAWHVERAGDDQTIQPWNPNRVPDDQMGTLVAIGSAPIAEQLRNAFDGLTGARIIADREMHEHRH